MKQVKTFAITFVAALVLMIVVVNLRQYERVYRDFNGSTDDGINYRSSWINSRRILYDL